MEELKTVSKDRSFDIDDVGTEINAVSALVTCLSTLFLNDGDLPNRKITGDALFGIEQYLDRIVKDIDSRP